MGRFGKETQSWEDGKIRKAKVQRETKKWMELQSNVGRDGELLLLKGTQSGEDGAGAPPLEPPLALAAQLVHLDICFDALTASVQAGSESKLQFGQSSPCLTGCCHAGGVQGDVQDGVQRCAVQVLLKRPSQCMCILQWLH